MIHIRKLMLIIMILLMGVSCCIAESEESILTNGTWVFDYDHDVIALKMNEDGTVWYKNQVYQCEKQADRLLLTDSNGETFVLRFRKAGDKVEIYQHTDYHRGSGTEDQEGLFGVWEGTEDGSSFVFTPTGFFLEDSFFSGTYMISEDGTSFLLKYGNTFDDTACFFQIENDVLTVEYPWVIVQEQINNGRD
jgi:hypothetical protein